VSAYILGIGVFSVAIGCVLVLDLLCTEERGRAAVALRNARGVTYFGVALLLLALVTWNR